MDERTQCAALPYVVGGDDTRVRLLTSRGTGRWIVPKGWPKTGFPPHLTAEHEALEEAGIRGVIGERAVGRYRYAKSGDDGGEVACVVDIFPLLVRFQHFDWPERHQREREWFDAPGAAARVAEAELAEILLRFSPSY